MTIMAQAPMKKKAYHHGDLRNAIIIQAVARARETGEKAIILREIAAEIGVSATAAYRHFTNRAQLVEEVGAKGFQECQARMTLAPVTDGGAAPVGERARLAAYLDLRNACIALLEFAADERSWCRLMFDGLGSSELVTEAASESSTVLGDLQSRGVAAGTFVDDRRLVDDRTFWAGIDGLGTLVMYSVYPGETAQEVLGEAMGAMLDLCTAHLLTDAGRQAIAAAGSAPTRICTDLTEWISA